MTQTLNIDVQKNEAESVQFRSVAQSCLTLCDPMNHSTLGLPVHQQHPESTQTHVHWVSDAIQPSHPLSSPSPPALNLSQNLASITSPIHNWVLFLLWLHPFILSRVISPLNSSSILGTYRPAEFIFQCPIFLPFHTVHGARILKWFAIPFSSGPHSVRPLHHDPSILGGSTRHGLVSS